MLIADCYCVFCCVLVLVLLSTLLKHAAHASAISNQHAACSYQPNDSLIVQYRTCGCVRNSAVLKFDVPLKLISGSKPV